MKVLLAVDSSKGSQIALDEVVARPWPAHTEFLLLTVLERSFARFPEVLRQAEQQAANFLKAAAQKFVRAARKCSTDVVIGTPRHAISEYARQWNADWIVLGSHGHGAIARFLLGSVAHGVLRTAPCSVAIVRPGSSDSSAFSNTLKILLATDGSEFSMAAVKSVACRPWPAGTQVKVLSVEELPVFENETTAYPLAAAYPASLLDELMENARNHAKDALEAAKKLLSVSRLQLVDSPVTAVGDPRSIILECAQHWPTDLIVLGSHGRRGFDRLLMGSVSEAVAMHAKCSVEVIRPGQKAPEKNT
jgi:nucleotide-binding universal stress UspA family protein